ncbi:hypothetical protein KM043_005633 [Ampulex compressa]|nr:hypothetical protein KM043_005633 [Ampulex compressa]
MFGEHTEVPAYVRKGKRANKDSRFISSSGEEAGHRCFCAAIVDSHVLLPLSSNEDVPRFTYPTDLQRFNMAGCLPKLSR